MMRAADLKDSLQSGSSAILKAMRRTYTRERFLDRVALIREHVPDCSLTTDVIVGFRWPYQNGPDAEPLADKLGSLRRYADEVIAKVGR